MELEIQVSDDMNVMRDSRPVKGVSLRWRIVRNRIESLSLSEWIEAHYLLLAQTLAVAFDGLTIGEYRAG